MEHAELSITPVACALSTTNLKSSPVGQTLFMAMNIAWRTVAVPFRPYIHFVINVILSMVTNTLLSLPL